MKKSYPLRINEDLFLKIQQIANLSSRSINKEFEFIINQFVLDYEKQNGEIIVNTDDLYQ